jgi:5-methylcytosine-specific restriction endonuclease McrA
MAAGTNAGSLSRPRILSRMLEGKAAQDLTYRARLLQHVELWGNLPVKMRPFWIAQRSRCSICGHRLALDRAGNLAATWDHVMPRARGGGGHEARNKAIAHRGCNQGKGDRPPTACELLFCEVTNEIVFSLERIL